MDYDKTHPSKLLVLGGLGFIGSHLLQNLLSFWDADIKKIRVVDKSVAQISFVSENLVEWFNSEPRIDFIQADLAKEASVDKIFRDQEDGSVFEYVVNLAGETRLGLDQDIFKRNCYETAVLCAQKAAQLGNKKFIHLSTAYVYKSTSKAKEDSKLKPWTKIAKYALMAEQTLAKIPGINLVILRPAIVYGLGDTTGLMPRISVAYVYKLLGEKMKFLWDKKLKINCVHVYDVVGGIMHCMERTGIGKGVIYNLADKTDLDQGKMNAILAKIFGISTSFVGSFVSQFAKLNLQAICQEANDKHLVPWLKQLEKENIAVSAVSPYIHKDLLIGKSLGVDGTAIQLTSFFYSHPVLTEEDIRECIAYMVKHRQFPEFV